MSKTPRASECTKLTDSVLHLRPGTHTDIKRKGKEKKREEGIKKKKRRQESFQVLELFDMVAAAAAKA